MNNCVTMSVEVEDVLLCIGLQIQTDFFFYSGVRTGMPSAYSRGFCRTFRFRVQIIGSNR